jgi:hypothetical protein
VIVDLNPELLQKGLEAKKNYRDLSLEHWWVAEFNRWNWWLSLALALVPLYIWWRYVDKKRILEICIYGLLVNILSSFLDVLGSELVWWDYPVRLIPNLPRLLPIDFTVIPVVYMLIYQYCPTWKSFVMVSIIQSAIFSFLMEPLMIYLNLYELVTWKLIYSFPIYILVACSCKIVVNLFLKVQKKGG